MTPLDLAYFAALLDGEGHITLSKVRKSMILVVGIANVCKKVLEQLQGHFGGCITHGNKVNHQVWVWKVTQREAHEALVQLLPYMRIKNEEARIALEFIASIKRDKSRVTDAELALRLKFRDRLKAAKYQYAEAR